MNVEKLIDNDMEIVIIDDAIDYRDRHYFYVLCCQSKYAICNASSHEIQNLEDRRLKCDLELNHPILERFFELDSNTQKIFLKYIPKDKYQHKRSYINLGITSDVNTVHNDNKTDNKTVLYYANTKWDPSWGGQTIFLDRNAKDIIKTVTPVPGRIVIFDGRMPHNVLPMNGRIVPSYRFTVALKFEERTDDITAEGLAHTQTLTTLDKSELSRIVYS
tara:strand:+ start:1575 stop:2228 length:654 start_codon:yes stop_codon:yes gene_type:complete